MHPSLAQQDERSAFVCWLYGLSGAGKSTISSGVAKRLREDSRSVVVLDGDSLRRGLCHDLGFTQEGRLENVRRTAEIARLLVEQDVNVLVALMTPQKEMRCLARGIVGSVNFLEVYVKCCFSICAERDPKGLYRMAEAGTLTQFVGKDVTFEEPVSPDLVIDTSGMGVDECVNLLFARLNDEISNSEEALAASCLHLGDPLQQKTECMYSRQAEAKTSGSKETPAGTGEPALVASQQTP